MRFRTVVFALLSVLMLALPFSDAAVAQDTPPSTDDALREVAVAQAVGALESYGAANLTYRVDGAGGSGNGQGWYQLDNDGSYPDAIMDVLVAQGHLDGDNLLVDPKDTVFGTHSSNDFMVYRCADRVAVFAKSDGIEPSTEDAAWWADNGCTRTAIDRRAHTYFQVSAPLSLDQAREVVVGQAIAALEAYGAANLTYVVENSGYKGRGIGWYDHQTAATGTYPVSVFNALQAAGAFDGIDPIADPKQGELTLLRMQHCKDRVAIFSHSDGIEPSAADAAWWADNNCTRYAIDNVNRPYFQLSQPIGDLAPPVALVNVAVDGVASQSSTELDGFAGRAIDGNTSGQWGQGSVTHTRSSGALAWWQVDLVESQSIDNVVVWNRTDCCTARLADFTLFVSDQPFAADATIAELAADANVWSVSHPGQLAGASVEFDVATAGRYVRIQKPSGSALSLAEVQVFATKSTPPPVDDTQDDLAVWRADGGWFVKDAEGNDLVDGLRWGGRDEVPLVGDVDGDGRDDMLIYNPAGSWFAIDVDGAQIFHGIAWGGAGNDTPLVGDINGDGQDDLLIYNAGAQQWFAADAGGAVIFSGLAWGSSGDRPLLGDVNGDGQDDLLLHSSSGHWSARDVDGEEFFSGVDWGGPQEIPLLGDMNGDGSDDLVVWNSWYGSWFARDIDGQIFHGIQWGLRGDHPRLADIDGDGRDDLLVWRPSTGTWYAKDSNENVLLDGFQMGASGDVPLVGDFGDEILPAVDPEGASKDAARQAAVSQIVAGFEDFARVNGTYRIEAGLADSGEHWFGERKGEYRETIASALESGGHLPGATSIQDPDEAKNFNNGFLIYRCLDRVAVFSMSSSIEPDPSDVEWWESNTCTRKETSDLDHTYFELSESLSAAIAPDVEPIVTLGEANALPSGVTIVDVVLQPRGNSVAAAWVDLAPPAGSTLSSCFAMACEVSGDAGHIAVLAQPGEAYTEDTVIGTVVLGQSGGVANVNLLNDADGNVAKLNLLGQSDGVTATANLLSQSGTIAKLNLLGQVGGSGSVDAYLRDAVDSGGRSLVAASEPLATPGFEYTRQPTPEFSDDCENGGLRYPFNSLKGPTLTPSGEARVGGIMTWSWDRVGCDIEGYRVEVQDRSAATGYFGHSHFYPHLALIFEAGPAHSTAIRARMGETCANVTTRSYLGYPDSGHSGLVCVKVFDCSEYEPQWETVLQLLRAPLERLQELNELERCLDANSDGKETLTDVVTVADQLDDRPPAELDANCDGVTNVSDVLEYLIATPTCGLGPVMDAYFGGTIAGADFDFIYACWTGDRFSAECAPIEQWLPPAPGGETAVVTMTRFTSPRVLVTGDADGQTVTVADRNDSGLNQQWIEIEVSGRVVYQLLDTNLCIEAETVRPPQDVHLATCDLDNVDQRWLKLTNHDGTFGVHHAAYRSHAWHSGGLGQFGLLDDEVDPPNQKWIINPVGDIPILSKNCDANPSELSTACNYYQNGQINEAQDAADAFCAAERHDGPFQRVAGPSQSDERTRWSMNYHISSDDGLVLEDINLGSRIMAERVSIPYLRVDTTVAFGYDQRLELRNDPLFGDCPGQNHRSMLAFPLEIDTSDPDTLRIEATYRIDQIHGLESELWVIQRYEFDAELADGNCEPHAFALPSFARETGILDKRFLPCSPYRFTVEYVYGGPAGDLNEIEIPQRMHFRNEGLTENSAAMMQDHDSIVGPILDWSPIRQREDVMAEGLFSGLNEGSSSSWDNFHQTFLEHELLTGPGFVPVRPGCPECVHMHWRWTAVIDEPGYYGTPGEPGSPLIPPGSPQSLDIGIAQYKPNELDPISYNDIGIAPDLGSGVEEETVTEPVLWYISSSKSPTDTFFGHQGVGGGFFSNGYIDLDLTLEVTPYVEGSSDLPTPAEIEIYNSGPGAATNVAIYVIGYYPGEPPEGCVIGVDAFYCVIDHIGAGQTHTISLDGPFAGGTAITQIEVFAFADQVEFNDSNGCVYWDSRSGGPPIRCSND